MCYSTTKGIRCLCKNGSRRFNWARSSSSCVAAHNAGARQTTAAAEVAKRVSPSLEGVADFFLIFFIVALCVLYMMEGGREGGRGRQRPFSAMASCYAGRAACRVLQLLKFGERSFTVSAIQEDGIGIGGEGRRVSSRRCRGASAP